MSRALSLSWIYLDVTPETLEDVLPVSQIPPTRNTPPGPSDEEDVAEVGGVASSGPSGICPRKPSAWRAHRSTTQAIDNAEEK